MTDFQHSIVLFSGEDGLPLEFNVRNTDEKALLKALIEHGGGLCSQSETAVHLISPGTKVLNADLGKKLVSTQYIFDCVKQNYLLDVNDYVFIISEARTSDISDEDSENIIANKQVKMPDLNFHDDIEVIDMDIDETLLSSHPMKDKTSISVVPSGSKQSEMQQNLTSSNTSESFIEGSVGVDSKFKISSMSSKSVLSPEYKPFTSTAKDAFSENVQSKFRAISDELSPIKGSQSLVSPLKTNNIFSSDDLKLIVQSQKVNFVERDENPVHTVVSSSHPIEDFDEFDNILLSKAQQKHQADEEERLSQSYTVSSSADAQVASKSNSEEIFDGGSSAVPDSPMHNENLAKEHQVFLKELETEVENVLKKPSPKSIQDKICLVKYLCCAMKLPPAKVLEMLPRL